MTTYILNSNANTEMLNKYCKPHKIETSSVISISVNPFENYQIEYLNKDGHYCTILVKEESL
jgi:hypothetical protein